MTDWLSCKIFSAIPLLVTENRRKMATAGIADDRLEVFIIISTRIGFSPTAVIHPGAKRRDRYVRSDGKGGEL